MRKINRAVKIRIYPNAEQRVQIEKTIGCSRFIYNCMLADKIEHYKKEKKMLRNTPASYKKEYPWLKEVDSLALANAQMHLESAFHKFFREPSAGFPRFKSKKSSRKSYTTNVVNGNIFLEGNYLKLPKGTKIQQGRGLKTLQDLFRKKNRVYVKGANAADFIRCLDLTKIMCSLCRELKPLCKILGVECMAVDGRKK